MNATIKESTLIEYGNQFVKMLAAQYCLPELRGVQFTESKIGREGVVVIKTGEVAVEPTGQMAGIVKSMTVRVEVCSNGQRTRGELSYRYEHHGGGSNGNSQAFVIVTENRYGEQQYVGAISDRLAYIYENQLQSERERSFSPAS